MVVSDLDNTMVYISRSMFEEKWCTSLQGTRCGALKLLQDQPSVRRIRMIFLYDALNSSLIT